MKLKVIVKTLASTDVEPLSATGSIPFGSLIIADSGDTVTIVDADDQTSAFPIPTSAPLALGDIFDLGKTGQITCSKILLKGTGGDVVRVLYPKNDTE